MDNNELEQKNLQADGAAYDDGLLDWDDEIQEDYSILPEGDYLFEVEKMERGTFLGSDKLPPCKEARLTLRVETPDGPVRLWESFRLLKRLTFLIYPFFVSIGVIENGKKGRMDWSRVPGARGRFHSKPGQFTGSDGKMRDKNEITWLDYDPQIMSQIEAQRSGFDLKRTSSGGSELPAWVTEARRSGACEDEDGDSDDLPF